MVYNKCLKAEVKPKDNIVQILKINLIGNKKVR